MHKPGQPIRQPIAGAPLPPGEPPPALPHATRTMAGAAGATQDFHCHTHPHFTPACPTCQQARANNLPFRNVDPHPAPSSRSFASIPAPGPAGFDAFTRPSLREIALFGATEGVSESLTDALLDSLL